ncbi:MAG: radical SAM protein [Deltaproteobacteria bacterium]|nr:radical SAM protein [Deltaproteobacteria bacterium]
MNYNNMPYMLYADTRGNVYEHPYYRMAGASGDSWEILHEEDLMPMPEFSKLFYIPDCPPVGLDPRTGQFKVVKTVKTDGVTQKCLAVAAFMEPGIVRSHLPAVDYSKKSYILPLWGYTAVGFRDDGYKVSAFMIEYNHKWDPRNYDDRKLVPAIRRFKKSGFNGALTEHLINCAVNNHCFAAKNLFLRRWEAPLPVARTCNAGCLGCLSLQPDNRCSSSQQRISFKPDRDEIVSLAVSHLENAPEPIVSFGQGCEGEPLMEYRLIAESIREIRKRTPKGTINLNTNGSLPDRVREVAMAGLDSIRISLNSARPELYRAYYNPKNYDFEDVVESISLSRQMGLYTMLNYLVFPGITDQKDEIEALKDLIIRTHVNFIHLKNLNIDPQVYLKSMPMTGSGAIGMKRMTEMLRNEFPDVELGYFNQPVR